MRSFIVCLLFLFVVNLSAQNLMNDFKNQKMLATNKNLVFSDPIIDDLISKNKPNYELNLSSNRSSDFPLRPLLISTSIGLAIGIPLGIINQVKKGSADCSRPGVTAHWTSCILGPHPLVKNIIIWGGLGITIGYTVTF